MVRDMERLAAERGLAFALPEKFPQNSLMAARLALLGADEGWIAAFTRAVYQAEFTRAADISERQALAPSCESLHLDSERIFSGIEEPDIKDRLKRQTADAQARGIFGAPSFLVGEELFWGDDRLGRPAVEQAFIVHSSDSAEYPRGYNDGDDGRAQDTAQDPGNFRHDCSPRDLCLRGGCAREEGGASQEAGGLHQA